MINSIKNKNWNNQQFRSEEETTFAIWLDAAIRHGLVEYWSYEPKKYQILSKEYLSLAFNTKSGKPRTHKYKVAKDQTYTPDFFVIFTNKFISKYKNNDQSPLYYYQEFRKFELIIYNRLFSGKCCCMFDVKPSNLTWVRSISTSASTFYIKQSLMWINNGIIVNKVVTDQFMKKTFVPDGIAFMKSRKVKTRYKRYINCKLESEVFLQKELF